MSQEFTILIDKPEHRREFVRRFTNWVNSCKPGVYRISICLNRPRRSDRQNRFYWPAVVTPFAAWLTREWGEQHLPDDAHEILKAKFLTVEKHDPRNGEVFTIVRSTTSLDTAEFNQYLEKCGEFLATYCGFVVPDPSEYHERDDAGIESAA